MADGYPSEEWLQQERVRFIDPSTLGFEERFGADIARRMTEIEHEVRVTLEAYADAVAVIDTFQTDRGSRCFVIMNGAVKAEGERSAPLMPSWRAGRIATLDAMKEQCIRQAVALKRTTDTRLNWRRLPAFELESSDLDCPPKFGFRIAWD